LRKGVLILTFIAALVLPNPFQTASYSSEPTIYDQMDMAERWLQVANLFWGKGDINRCIYFINKSLSYYPLERAHWIAINANMVNHEYFSAYLSLAELENRGIKEAIGQRAYIKMNREFKYEEGLKDLIKYKSLSGQNTYIRAWFIDHYIGMAYHLLGDHEKAIEHYNLCIQEEGEEWTVVYNFLYRGLAEEALGMNENALISYKKMNELCNICPEGHYFLANLYRKMKRYDDAQMEYADAYLLKQNIYANKKIHDLREEDIERQWLMYGKQLVMASED